MTAGAPNGVAPPRDILARFWAWWVGELRGLVPATLLRRFQEGGQNALWVRVTADELILGTLHKGRVVSRNIEISGSRTASSAPYPTGNVRLDPALVFETILTFPQQARATLRQIIGHHLGLVIPLDPATIAFDHVILRDDPATGNLRVAVAITKYATLDRARQAAWQAGFSPVEAVIDRAGDIDRRFDFLRHERRVSRPSNRAILPRAIEAAAVAMVLAAIGVGFARIDLENDQLASRVAIMRGTADEVIQLQVKADQLSESLAVLNARLRAPSQEETLEDISRLLPDDTSLSLFRAHDGDVEIMGDSRHAARLIGLLEGSAIFRAPRFQSPVITNPGGDEHFDVVVTLDGRAR